MSDPIIEDSKVGDVEEEGLRSWQAVKDAINKE
jgi:hypothetical protein